MRKGAYETRSRSTAIVGPIRPSPAHQPQREQPQPDRVFAHGSCQWCGDTYTAMIRGRNALHRYCSPRCGRNHSESKRQRGSWWITKRDRQAIYDRDGWACQLCMRPVDKELHHTDNWSASLDHIIPRSHQLVPDHSARNLRLTHRWCNAVRGDNTYVSDDMFLTA